jgi:hypothetical protein
VADHDHDHRQHDTPPTAGRDVGAPAPDAARPHGTPAVPAEDAGPRPGEHPSVADSGSRPSTAVIFVGLLILAALIYGGVWVGMLGN